MKATTDTMGDSVQGNLSAIGKSITVVIVNNPLAPASDNRTYQVSEKGKSVLELLGPIHPRYLVFLNTEELVGKDLSTIFPKFGDIVIAIPFVQGGNEGESGGKSALRLVMMVVLIVASQGVATAAGGGFWGSMAGAAVTVGGSMLINKVLPPPTMAMDGEEDKSYGIDGPKNTSEENLPVPVVYGECWVGGNLVGFHTENATAKTQDANLLYVISEGEIESIGSIRLNDQPLSAYTDVQTFTRLGAANQDSLPGFQNVVIPVNRNSLMTTEWTEHDINEYVNELAVDVVAPEGIYQIYKNKVEHVGVRFSFQIAENLNGQMGPEYWQPMLNGRAEQIENAAFQDELIESISVASGTYDGLGDVDRQGSYVTFTITAKTGEVLREEFFLHHRLDADISGLNIDDAVNDTGDRLGDSPYWTGYTETRGYPSHSSESIILKTQVPYRFTVRSVPLNPAKKYKIRWKNLDERTDKLVNALHVTDIKQITYDSICYNNTAMLSISVKLTDQLSSMPTVISLVKGRKVSQYSETTGEWVVAWTDNPAWIVLDALSHERYGAGYSLDRFNIPQFRQWANYCSANNLKFNGVLANSTSVIDALAPVFRVGRANMSMAGSRINLSIQMPKEPRMMFNSTNIRENSLSIGWSDTSERATELHVSYASKALYGERKVVVVSDPTAIGSGSDIKVSDLQLLGVDNEAQAYAEGVFSLNYNKLQMVSTFEAPIESIAVGVGDAFYLQHDMPSWGAGGLTTEAATKNVTTVIQLDREIQQVVGSEYQIMLHRDSSEIWSGVVIRAVGNAVYLSSGFDSSTMTNVKRLVDSDGNDREIVETFIDTDTNEHGVILRYSTTLNPGKAVTALDTDTIDKLNVTSSAGQRDFVTLTSPIPFDVAAGAKWILGLKDIITQKMTVTEISGDSDHYRTITALEYSDDVFDTSAAITVAPVSRLPEFIYGVSDIAISEIYSDMAGAGTTDLQVTWTCSNKTYVSADVWMRINQIWNKLGTGVNDFLIKNVSPQSVVELRIAPSDAFGNQVNLDRASSIVYKVTSVGAKPSAPSTPTDLMSVVGVDYIDLTWETTESKTSNQAFRIYTIADAVGATRLETDFANATLLTTVFSPKHTVFGLDSETEYRYWVVQTNSQFPELGSTPLYSGIVKTDRKPDVLNYEVPAIMTGLASSSNLYSISLSWTPVFSGASIQVGVGKVEVWRSATNNLAQASLRMASITDSAEDVVGTDQAFYYWIRAISTGGTPGSYSSAGVHGTSLVAATFIAEKIRGQLDQDAFLASIRPPRVLATLPAVDGIIYKNGDLVTLTTDGKLYRAASGAWTKAIDGADIGDGSLMIAKFATGLRPPRVVTALPTIDGTIYKNGDLATLTTDGKLYRVAAGVWTKSVDGADIVANSIVAGTIAAGAVGADQIAAEAITTEKMTANSINADRLLTNSINTSKLAAGAVTAEKMLIGSQGSALNQDPSCVDPSAWTGSGLTFVTITDGKVGGTALRGAAGGVAYGAKKIAVDSSKVYRVRAWVRKNASANGGLYLGVALQDSAGANIESPSGSYWYVAALYAVPSTSWNEYVGYIGVEQANSFPSNAKTMVPLALLNYGGSIGYMEVQDFRLEEVIGSTLIKDGAITTEKMTVGSIDGDRIKANSLVANQIDTRGLSIKDSNGVVIFSAGSPLQPANAAAALQNSNISIGANGALYGGGGGAVTIGGLGYTGALNATKNVMTHSSSAPASPSDGDLWVDTSVTPSVTKIRVAGLWQIGANYVSNTNQITDGAGLGSTATWAGVAGAGKPADNATVGAQAGVNLKDSAGTPLSDASIKNTAVTISKSGALSGAGGGQVTQLDLEDTRSVDSPPSYYSRGTTREFKAVSVINLSWAATGTYCTLETVKPWVDNSGGHAHQYAYTEGGKTFKRYGGSSDSGWTVWVQDLDRNSYSGDLNATFGAQTGVNLKDSAGATIADTGIKNTWTENGLTHVSKPIGGSLGNATGAVTGALEIRLPVGYTNTMMRIVIEVYEYETGLAYTYTVSGYNYASGDWYNVSASYDGPTSRRRIVQFGHNYEGYCAIWIGYEGDVWQYPQVRVTEAVLGYSNYSAATWSSNWRVSFVDGMDTISTVVAEPRVGSAMAGIDKITATNAATYIANAAIDYAKIGSVDASTITVGTLAAARIAANSLNADKLEARSIKTDRIEVGAASAATLFADVNSYDYYGVEVAHTKNIAISLGNFTATGSRVNISGTANVVCGNKVDPETMGPFYAPDLDANVNFATIELRLVRDNLDGSYFFPNSDSVSVSVTPVRLGSTAWIEAAIPFHFSQMPSAGQHTYEVRLKICFYRFTGQRQTVGTVINTKCLATIQENKV